MDATRRFSISRGFALALLTRLPSWHETKLEAGILWDKENSVFQILDETNPISEASNSAA